MLTYTFNNKGSDSLYESLYKQIKHDIQTDKLKSHEKLPSKRSLAKHLSISIITVENAYEQLVAEGYIYSKPKSGFYVSDLSLQNHKNQSRPNKKLALSSNDIADKTYLVDFVANATLTDNFPFSTWSKLMRETMSENKKNLLIKSPSTGVFELRVAIVNYLYQFRGLIVEPEQIVVGAGTEYLYSLIIQLLGQDKTYAVEDPGYQMIRRIYQSNNVRNVSISLDSHGINITELEQSSADVLHITPSHHFPTGIVTPISRRYELLSWASKAENRFIIEDDYDSEFRFKGKPIPALQSIDTLEKVIYINTFSKSLTSTIRISYMVLPKSLMKRYNNMLSFYACTVSNFEQYTMAKFIDQGYFERHINKMRNYYKNIRDAILTQIRIRMNTENSITILEENSGLHFLMKINTKLTDEEIVTLASNEGIHVSCLSQYYHDQINATQHTLVINYSGVDANNIKEGVDKLLDCIFQK